MKPTLRHFLPGALLGLVLGCASQDDARVQQLLTQRGFGERVSGDASEQYYLGITDRILLVALDPAHAEVNGQFIVRTDGVIDIPMLGEIYVAGMSLPDVEELLTRHLRKYISTIRLDVQLIGSQSKFFYVDGEVGAGGRRPFFGNETMFQVVFDARPSILSDDDAIRLIRSDPYRPLVMLFDYDDMLQGGWSQPNTPIKENDIIYVPPNMLGYMARLLEAMLAPLQRAFAGLLSASRLISITDTFGDPRFNNGRNRFGGGGFGGFHGDELWCATPVAPPGSGDR